MENLFEISYLIFQVILTLIGLIWWIFLFVLSLKLLNFSYLLWKNTKWTEENVERLLLEIKLPREILKPLKVMEDVFSVIWGGMLDPQMKRKNTLKVNIF